MPRIVARIPATMSGGVFRLESTRLPTPAAINTTATIAEWCAGFGLGGRAERASVTGTRTTARPGHQAAAVAPTTATRRIMASSVQGRLSRSRRWPSAGSSAGAIASQSVRPTIVPISAPIAPTIAPFHSSTSRRCFSVAPTAASMPSWRSRRRAMTAKPAAAMSEANSTNTVATENISSASAGRSLPRVIHVWRACDEETPSARLARASGEAPAAPLSTRTVTWSGAPAEEGETSANSSLRSEGFSTMPTTVRRFPSMARVPPSSSPRTWATPSVTATWPRPSG